MIEGGPPSERSGAPDEPAPRSNSPEYGASATAPAGAASDGRAYGGAADAPDVAFPWPPAEGASVVAAFVQTWQGATFQPSALFRALPDRASLGSALLYYLPLGIIIQGAHLFWTIVRSPGGEQDSTLSTVAAGDITVPPLVVFLLSPLLLILLLFLAAGVTHVLLMLFGRPSRDYRTTTRVFAFAYSPMIFSVVPLIGEIIGFIWMVVIAIVGVREAQRTSTGRAAAAVLIPVLFMGMMWLLTRVFTAAQRLLEKPV